MRYDAVLAETIGIRGADGDLVEAYTARPMDPGPRGGVLVIHHMPGYDREAKEIVRRFAVEGYDAIAVNLHWRDAPGADPDDAAAASRANGGVPDDRFVGDAAGAVRWLRERPTSNGRVATIGFCSGGRQAVLSAIELDVQAAIDCYGAFVTAEPPEGFPIRGATDRGPARRRASTAPGAVRQRRPQPVTRPGRRAGELLREHGKTYEFHRYDGAGHAFFSVDRPSYRVAAALDGWQRIHTFLATHLREG